MTRIPFPNVPIGEFTVARHFTAPGLFFYRYMQAQDLLHFPDMAGGDMSAEQRREALDRMVSVQRPLAALVLFLNIVALEDLIRDLGARLADTPSLDAHFPSVSQLRLKLTKNSKSYARLDIDPAPLSNWPEVNKLYCRVLGVEPITSTEFPKLHDLALLRHTVAHHAALVRPIDAPRFQYWEVQPNTLLNPPIEFVREMSALLYRTGRDFQAAIAKRVFSVILAKAPTNWFEKPSELIIELIELLTGLGSC